MKKPKIIVVLGATTTGKTKLGVKLTIFFGGEIVSADSRQVYKRMDIGTGKDLKDFKVKTKNGETVIRHHLIDVADPRDVFSLADYQKKARRAIDDILKRGKIPIIVGGSGLYIQALIDEFDLTSVKPNIELRNELEKKCASELFLDFLKINKSAAQDLNNSDKNNKRRLIRYIEIEASGKQKSRILANNSRYDAFLIGLRFEKDEIERRIFARLEQRLLKEGMVREVEELFDYIGNWKKIEDFGLEYKYIAYFLQNRLDYDEMKEQLFVAIRQYAKKQGTWFRRWEKQGAKINWVSDYKESKAMIHNFLTKE